MSVKYLKIDIPDNISEKRYGKILEYLNKHNISHSECDYNVYKFVCQEFIDDALKIQDIETQEIIKNNYDIITSIMMENEDYLIDNVKGTEILECIIEQLKEEER